MKFERNGKVKNIMYEIRKRQLKFELLNEEARLGEFKSRNVW